jgi:hypothetical protein
MAVNCLNFVICITHNGFYLFIRTNPNQIAAKTGAVDKYFMKVGSLQVQDTSSQTVQATFAA